VTRVAPLLFLLFGHCLAQQPQTAELPSDAEINELVTKANEKVSAFETAIKLVRSDLDSQEDADLLKKDQTTAATAHEIIHALQKNGPTAYALVALISVLDDMALDSSKTALVLLIRQGLSKPQTQANLAILGQASTSCRDISELLLHATLRMIDVEEAVVRRITSEKH